ncbi:MAG: TIGR01906 family membrane protein [Chloroflexota bacterium]
MTAQTPDRSLTQPAAPGLARLTGWLATLLLPVALVLSAIRLLLAPWFLPFEYNMPGFPADPYGFTKADRLYWSAYAMDYLVNDAGIEYLGDLRFADGSAVYNERELRHMVDVKAAIQITLRVWLAALVGLVLLALLAWRKGWTAAYIHGLRRGGWLTAAFIVVVITFVALSFGAFFVFFHDVFFQPGTWMFEWSDTLIRLFPERFWRDIFVYVGVMSGGAGLLIALLLRRR